MPAGASNSNALAGTAREASPSPGAIASAPDELEYSMYIVDNIMDPVEPTRQPEQSTTLLPSSLCIALFGPSDIILDRKRLNNWKPTGDTLQQARDTRRRHPSGSPYLVLCINKLLVNHVLPEGIDLSTLCESGTLGGGSWRAPLAIS